MPPRTHRPRAPRGFRTEWIRIRRVRSPCPRHPFVSRASVSCGPRDESDEAAPAFDESDDEDDDEDEVTRGGGGGRGHDRGTSTATAAAARPRLVCLYGDGRCVHARGGAVVRRAVRRDVPHGAARGAR